MKILGISAFYHDSAAALVVDGEVVAAAQEERFTRIKHDPAFPHNAVRYALEEARIRPSELDAVVFYEKPFTKFERLLETYYVFAPRGLRSFLSAIPVWVKEKLFLKNLIMDEMSKLGDFDQSKTKLLFSDHHLSHAGSAFFPSPFEDAAIVTVDGVGEWTTSSICHGKGNGIEMLKVLKFPHSIGLLYSAFTYYLGFKVNSGEYKLMGLAPYGDPGSDRVRHYKKLITERLVDIKDDGSIWLDQGYFDYATGLTMVHDKKFEALFGIGRRGAESKIEQAHCDMALAIQQVTEDVVIKMCRTARELTGSRNLCLAGGVALNCVANKRVLDAGLFDNVWIQPAAGDAGGALGAAFAAYHINMDQPRQATGKDKMRGAYLGPEYGELEILQAEKKYGARSQKFSEFDELAEKVAGLLSEGKVIGWMQGRMEWGPRALGARSIIGDPRDPEMQKRLNLKIKFRESFRPFAPSVLAERSTDYFNSSAESPYMLLIDYVRDARRRPLPDGYHQLPVKEKLYHLRSDIPAITHLDYSARLQTVHKDTNPRYHRLIEKFMEKTGYGVVVNTSFNVRGEPIVCTPEDAYRCFMRTEMDFLVVGDRLYDKKDQPVWSEERDWRQQYELD